MASNTSTPRGAGSDGDAGIAAADPSTSPSAPGAAPPEPGRSLTIEVVWGEITQVEADVCAVGHYIGVRPQRAELAVDRAVSGVTDDATGRKLIITEMTARGALRGELGEIAFFPLGGTRLAAINGMGRPGTFTRSRLEILTRTLVSCVGLLPRHDSLATVLIGSGEGNNLQVGDCVETLLRAAVEVVRDDETLQLKRLQIVELNLDRALEILDHAKAVAKRYWPDGVADRLAVAVHPTFQTAPGRQIDTRFGYSMVLAALAEIAGSGDESRALEQVLSALPDESNVKANVRKALEEARKGRQEAAAGERLQALARQFRIRIGDDAASQEVAVRVAFWADQDRIRATAITNTVTVTERELRKRLGLVQAAVERLQDAGTEQKKRYAADLYRLLVPRDLREVLDGGGPLVLEVDPSLALVQWEMLLGDLDVKPLAVARPVARQLRTLYSPRPSETSTRQKLRALVVGDPGDERRGHGLPDARDEAAAVWEALDASGVVDMGRSQLLIGPPADGSGAGTYELKKTKKRVEPADYFEVVQLLLSGDFDLVHYCGHARFDPDNPSDAGWVFKAGVLTAADLDGMVQAPSLVIANACLSARSGQVPPQEERDRTRRRGDPRLVAALADEFFHCGVADYIGTAWEVSSKPATTFAKRFYQELLGGQPIGDAVWRARAALYQKPDDAYTWGAYQHYGDPTRKLR